MAAKPCSERATEGDMSKDTARKDEKKRKKEGKKKKKKEEEAGKKGQEQTSDAAVEGLAAEGDKVGEKQSSKSRKSKHKHDDVCDQVVTREDGERKKEHQVVLEESSQKRTVDTAAENSAADGDNVEGKQSSKSKKSKHRHSDAAEACADDQLVTREDRKRKKEHPVVLEGSSQPLPEVRKEKEKAARSKNKGKRVSIADSAEVFRTEGGDSEGIEGGKKKKRKSKEGMREGIKEKEKAAQSNKGKRVSFADSVEVFRTEGGDSEGTEGEKKKKKKIKAAQSKKKAKRVSFADSAEVFSTEGGDDEDGGSSDESKFVHGQRFTPEEDATLMEAISDFIEMKQLGEKGFEMIKSVRKHKELMHCWDVIGKSLPHRPHTAIYCRARTLLNRSNERKWTEEEKEYIRRFVEKNGRDWKTLAHELGKCPIHVKDTWRRIKSDNLKKGHWTQDEHQQLFDLVNLDLRMKAHQIKNRDNRKLRDNIAWEDISDKLTTRNHKNCCIKWYDTLASPLVRKGIWADIDDYLLVEALQKDDAVCVEDVDWDSLLDHRSGEVCRERWNQMVRGLGGHREKPFIEQIDVLSRRYCPEMIEYRKPEE